MLSKDKWRQNTKTKKNGLERKKFKTRNGEERIFVEPMFVQISFLIGF